MEGAGHISRGNLGGKRDQGESQHDDEFVLNQVQPRLPQQNEDELRRSQRVNFGIPPDRYGTWADPQFHSTSVKKEDAMSVKSSVGSSRSRKSSAADLSDKIKQEEERLKTLEESVLRQTEKLILEKRLLELTLQEEREEMGTDDESVHSEAAQQRYRPTPMPRKSLWQPNPTQPAAAAPDQPRLSFSTRVMGPAPQINPQAQPQSEVQTLADALVTALRSQNSQTERFIARQSTSSSLPIFSGNPLDWPVFAHHFRQSTQDCGFTPSQNMARLEKALRGEAKRSVRALMIIPSNSDAVMDTLEQRYGRPEYVIGALIDIAKKMPTPKESKLSSFLDYFNAIQNLVTTIEALQVPAYLNNPQLLQELVDKLPDSLKIQWGMKAAVYRRGGSVSLVDFRNWTSEIAEATSSVTVPKFSFKEKRDDDCNFTAEEVKTTKAKPPCVSCKNPNHGLIACEAFKKMSDEDKWSMVKSKNVCFRCLRTGHGIKKCKSRSSCEVDGCSKRHHTLLHGETAQARPKTEEPRKENVTEMNATLEAITGTSILSMAVVTLHGPGGKTLVANCLLDGGSTVTLLSAEAAAALEIDGIPDPLRIRWTNSKLQEDLSSKKVNFWISPINQNKKFKLNNVRTVKNMKLPAQRTDIPEIVKMYPHLKTQRFSILPGERPVILLGQPHASLWLSRNVIEKDADSPVLAETRLGWVLHGPLRGEATEESTFVCVHESTDDALHNLVKESFTLESIGIKTNVSVRSKDDMLAEDKMKALTKRISNSASFLEKMGVAAASNSKDLAEWSECPTQRALGLHWLPQEDAFIFRVNLERAGVGVATGEVVPTKRAILRLIMLVWDPLGFLGNYLVKARILLQDLWKSKLSWDDQIDEQQFKRWCSWTSELSKLSDIRIPRCYSSHASISPDVQLHIFADASEKASCCIAYLRVLEADELVSVSVIMAKVRVAPVKPCSVPRLELTAALMASRLGKFLLSELDITIHKVQYWTDAMTVLRWLRSDAKKFQQFVAVRVGEIQENSDVKSWRWVPSSENPADDATRDGKADLSSNSRWLTGPSFLKLSPDEFPVERNVDPSEDHEMELRKEFVAVVTTEKPVLCLPDIARFSNYMRLLRATALIVRLLHVLQKKADPKRLPLEKAELLLIRRSQWESYPMEMQALEDGEVVSSKSSLCKLSPVLDQNGVLRMDSRVVSPAEHLRYPIIIDPKNPLTKLLIQFYHKMHHHAGEDIIRNELRQRFWIPKLRNAVRKVVRECFVCRKKRVRPQAPQMAPLPYVRTQIQPRPFHVTGMDYFGPMEVTVGRRREKKYGVLFTCMNTRAVHLELASSLSTDSCVMAIMRMCVARGKPAKIFSDNGTNLRGAEKEILEALDELEQERMTGRLQVEGIEWNFIPPASPHMGGTWERLVRSIKTAMYTILKSRAPKEEVLWTVLKEAEGVVNSRPLVDVPVDPDAPEALTPYHFLIGTSSPCAIPGDYEVNRIDLQKQWRFSQSLADMFWKRWVKEYLPTLQRRAKWHQRRPEVQVGDLVIVLDESLKRSTWPLGLVTTVFPGKDNIVRVAEVKTSTGVYRRPVVKLARLDIMAATTKMD